MMPMAYLLTCIVLLIAGVMLLYRAISGPTVYDRILALNAVGTKTVVVVAVVGFLSFPEFFLDTSIVYALVNFVATIAILKYVEFGRL